MRFQLIDRVSQLEPGVSITTVKNLTIAEEYLADHFPGFPVMPGVLVIESMVQASSWLMRATKNFEYSTILLKQAKAVRFKSFVAPGDCLTVECKVHKWEDRTCTLKVKARVEDRDMADARLIMVESNLGQQNEKLQDRDERLIANYKLQWQYLNPEAKSLAV